MTLGPVFITVFLLISAQPASANSFTCWIRQIHQSLTAQRSKTEALVSKPTTPKAPAVQTKKPIPRLQPIVPQSVPVTPGARRKAKLEAYNYKKESELALEPETSTVPESSKSVEKRQPATQTRVDGQSVAEKIEEKSNLPASTPRVREFISKNQRNYYHEC